MLTQEQKEQRLNFVCGSDAAVICGLNISPSGELYKTRLQLWMEKTGRLIPEDIGHLNHIKFGNYMEDGVAKWFSQESGKPLLSEERGMLIHPSLSWMAGNVDRFILGENAILECKTAYNSTGWGDGENIIPPYYLMQVAHYCAVGAFDRAYIAVVFRTTGEMRWYQYDRNLELEAKLIAREQDFWLNNVLQDVAPPPENAQDILLLYKETKADPIVADEIIEAHAKLLPLINKQIKELIERADALKQDMQLFMQDHDTLLDNSGKVQATWKYTQPISRFDAKQLKIDNYDLWCKYMRKDEPQRRFNLTKEKD